MAADFILDDVDRNIVAQLRANGRATNQQIADRLGLTGAQRPSCAATSTTDTPWAACAFSTFSALQVRVPSVCSRPSSTYSWFITSSPRRLPSSGK